MAITEAQATKPFQLQIDRLQKNTGPITGATGAGQLQQDKLQESKYAELARARQGLQSDVQTGKALSQLTGDRGFASDIMDREQNNLQSTSDRAVTGSFERMADVSKSNDLRFQDERAFDSNKRMAKLEQAKADAQNKLRISEYQESQQSDGVGALVGGVVGAVAGIYMGNPALGYSIGSSLGGYVD